MKINSIIDLVKDLDTSRQTKNLNKLLIRILLHLQVEFSYLNFESMSEDIHMVIGFKSAKVLCGKGNIRAITIPGRKIVSCLHKGNYTELASLYREMQEWIATKGYKSSGASIEYYYSKPGTSEEELVTKVEMPVL